MTTTIVPSAGAGALFTQQGVGTTPGYSALDDRRSSATALQEGVLNASDFMVIQRGAGANLSVDIGMPTGGFAWVQGDTINGQGLYCVPVHSATINEAIATADATNPRVDQVILEVLDNVLDASGNNLARTRILTGTPSVGATLANRTGVAALPGSALLLADVLVGNGVVSVDNTKIRDRRKWARGAYDRILRTAGDYTTASTTAVALDSTNLNPRIECSGVPLRVMLRSAYMFTSVAGAAITAQLFLDGALAESSGPTFVQDEPPSGALWKMPVVISWDLIPAAGSHLIGPFWLTSTGTATMAGGTTAGRNLLYTIEEIVRQNAANNTTTSG